MNTTKHTVLPSARSLAAAFLLAAAHLAAQVTEPSPTATPSSEPATPPALAAEPVPAVAPAEPAPAPAPAKPVVVKKESIARFAIAAEIGTAGYGPAVVLTATKRISFNIGYTFLDYDEDFNDEDTDYTGTLKLSNPHIVANIHPFAGTFHLSAGVYFADNKVDVVARPKANSTYEIGDQTYTGAQVGTLTGTVELHDGATPYVGLGWSKGPANSGFGFFFNVGVLLGDTPKATLAASGPIATQPAFQAELRKEEAELNKDLDGFDTYPVVQLGLVYRF